METITFTTCQVVLSGICFIAAGFCAGVAYGMDRVKKHRLFAVQTIVKQDGTHETHVMAKATQEEILILAQLETAATKFLELDTEGDNGGSED